MKRLKIVYKLGGSFRMYDEEQDEYEKVDNVGVLGKLYIIKVLKQYGVEYAMLLLLFALLYFLVIIPATAIVLYKGLVWLINVASFGNDNLKILYCAIMVGGVVVAIASWIIEKVLDRKYGKMNTSIHKS